MNPDHSSSKTELPLCIGVVVASPIELNEYWAKWSDVQPRLAQLAQEQATHKADVEAWRKSVGYVEAKLVEEHDEANVVIEKLVGEKKQLEAALGEIRQALQQMTEKYETLLARVGGECLSDRQDLPRQTSTGDR